MSREVVVTTGATAGVGRATARAFAERGARIGLLARGATGLDATKEDVEARGGDALPVPTDVSDHEQVEAAAAAVEEAFGPVDVWVNNAAVSVFTSVTDLEPNEYRRVTEVTYLGQVYGARAALRRMIPRNHGSIVFVGSPLAYRGMPLQSAYSGAKHGIRGFFRSLHAELRHEERSVDLTLVHLPALNTPHFEWSRNKMNRRLQPVSPIYQPEVAANAVCWAADHDRREVCVTWSTVRSIFAGTLFPRLTDRYLGRTGYETQMQEEETGKESIDNLWTPIEEDKGPHGPFDERARDGTLQWWVSRNKPWLLVAGLGLVVGLARWLTGAKTASE